MTGKETILSKLTLHSLYSLLTQQDYPVRSWRVFPPGATKGETLLSFWHAFLRDALPEDLDPTFLDPLQKRSRNASRLLNASGSSGLMASWFQSLSPRLDQRLLLRFAKSWMTRLSSLRYDARVLTIRLNAFLNGLQDSPELSEDELSFFHLLCQEINGGGEFSSDETVPMMFRHSLMLSWLTLYAIYASRPAEPALARLRICYGASCDFLYQLFQQETNDFSPRVISSRQCVLCAPRISEPGWFGRQAEMDRAIQCMNETGRLAVNGIGGIGKTEFVRQLLPLLLRIKRYQRLAFIQYTGTLAGSISAAFPALWEASPAQILSLFHELLDLPGEGKTLLLIDDVNQYPGQDPDLASLSTLSCDMILTSRFFSPDGFAAVTLEGLDDNSAQKLFFHYAGDSSSDLLPVQNICTFAAGHPLAITTFASLCRARFWPPSRLLEHLQNHGITELSFIRQSMPLRLAEVFQHTFDLSALSEKQLLLLEILSILPYQYYLPENLLPFTADCCASDTELADQCQLLHDLGWLLRSDAGYAIHPMIAETVRLRSVRAEDFPKLWAYVSTQVDRMDPGFHQTLISLLTHTSELTLTAVRALASLEQRIGVIPYVHLAEDLYQRHNQFLEEHPHTAADTADYWLGQGIRDILIFSRQDRLDRILRKILSVPEGITPRSRSCAYSLLEYASVARDLTVVEELFSALRPEDSDSLEAADWLISYSVKQRRGDHDHAAALSSLIRADQLLLRAGETDTLRRSNLDYRRAFCLLDLGRLSEARPLLENCLRIMRQNGLPEDCSEMLSTRSTYAVVLYNLDFRAEAASEFQSLQQSYCRLGQQHTGEYAKMMNNYALLMDLSGDYEEAVHLIRKVLTLDEQLILPDDILATHFRNAALLLAHHHEEAEALPLAERAIRLRESVFGPDSPWVADAKAVYALVLAQTGDPEAAVRMISDALDRLLSSWGPDHRHTRNAQAILDDLSRKDS